MAALKRRGFLGGLTALMAAPAANALDQAGVASDGFGMGNYAPPPTVNLSSSLNSLNAIAGSGGEPWWIADKMKLAAMKTFAPWLLEKQRVLETKGVHRLDINIASLKSVSAAGKINMQRNLQYRRWLDEKASYFQELEDGDQISRFTK